MACVCFKAISRCTAAALCGRSCRLRLRDFKRLGNVSRPSSTDDSKANFVANVSVIENQKMRPEQVVGPLGESLTLENLPPTNTMRWVARRKAEVVAAVNGGLLSIEDVLEMYNLTLEEFVSWQRAIDRVGLPGLRVTRIQHYRGIYERKLKY
jgi:hypothetical protein